MRRLTPWLLLQALVLWAPRAHADGGLTITKAQLQLYRDYQDALTDERVQKIKPKERLGAIAKNFKVKLPVLEAAIAAGEKEAEQVEPTEVAAIKGAFAGSPLEGKIGDVRVDAKKGHVIAYVQWNNSDSAKLDQEACWAAVRAMKAAPLVGTFDLYAQDAAHPDKRIYSSLIGADRAANIKEDQIVDFATTRYVRLFEKREVSAP
ncbi:MAG: hypothetical protein JST54_34280 [Deltaproteobacteria bacterium]|nr:hypothetical protein [Deltaproteobacteria bacterium]